jgi:hypothetical protein
MIASVNARLAGGRGTTPERLIDPEPKKSRWKIGSFNSSDGALRAAGYMCNALRAWFYGLLE